MRTRVCCLLFAALHGCGGGHDDCPPAAPDASGVDGGTNEFTRALEGAHFMATCSGPNVIAMVDLTLGSANSVLFEGTGRSGVRLTGSGDLSVGPPIAEPISRGVAMQEAQISCMAEFDPLQGDVLYLVLLCQVPSPEPRVGSLTLDVHADIDPSGVLRSESAQIVGMSDGTALCDGTLSGYVFSYTFSLASQPTNPVVNLSRTLTGG